MFTFNVDLGQLIIVSLIGIVGWFVNRTIQGIEKKLERHDQILGDLTGEVQFLLGKSSK